MTEGKQTVVYGSALVAFVLTICSSPLFVKAHEGALGLVGVGFAVAAAWGAATIVAWIMRKIV